MTTAETRHILYSYLDIVSYSVDRSVEAQTEIIAVLNRLVRESLGKVGAPGEVIFMPTGDGICIAFADFAVPYDIHLKFSLELLSLLHGYNEQTSDRMRQFELRIGLNQNVDNLVTDINGNRNVAGAGVNIAQRVMALGGGGNILVSEAVYDILQHREMYMDAFVRYTTVVKHDVVLPVYHYVKGSVGLNEQAPRKLTIGEDEIDSNLRKCLEDRKFGCGERECFREAAKAWLQKVEDLSWGHFIEDDEKDQFERLKTSLDECFKMYCEFVGQSFWKFEGSMFLTFNAWKMMDLAKSYYEEMKWLNDHLEERRDNRMPIEDPPETLV